MCCVYSFLVNGLSGGWCQLDTVKQHSLCLTLVIVIEEPVRPTPRRYYQACRSLLLLSVLAPIGWHKGDTSKGSKVQEFANGQLTSAGPGMSNLNVAASCVLCCTKQLRKLYSTRDKHRKLRGKLQFTKLFNIFNGAMPQPLQPHVGHGHTKWSSSRLWGHNLRVPSLACVQGVGGHCGALTSSFGRGGSSMPSTASEWAVCHLHCAGSQVLGQWGPHCEAACTHKELMANTKHTDLLVVQSCELKRRQAAITNKRDRSPAENTYESPKETWNVNIPWRNSHLLAGRFRLLYVLSTGE